MYLFAESLLTVICDRLLGIKLETSEERALDLVKGNTLRQGSSVDLVECPLVRLVLGENFDFTYPRRSRESQ